MHLTVAIKCGKKHKYSLGLRSPIILYQTCISSNIFHMQLEVDLGICLFVFFLIVFWNIILIGTHRSSELEVEVALNPLLGDRLGDTLGVTTLELTRQQVTQPALQKGSDATHEEQPYSPAGRPEPTARAFTYWTLQKVPICLKL